jgi:flagellar biosynthetic protein FlhB
MSGEDSDQEKQHEPTQKRLDDARQRGDISRSPDVVLAASYLGLVVALMAGGGAMAEAAARRLAYLLSDADRLAPSVLGPGGILTSARLIGPAALALLPLVLAPLAAAALALAAQGSFAMSGEKLMPKMDRISPIAIAKQKFGLHGMVEFGKASIKLVAVSFVLALVLRGQIDALIGLVNAPPPAAALAVLGQPAGLLVRVLAIAAVIAAIDFVWQRFDHRRRLRMSHQEMRDEVKDSEGDPHMKAMRRQRGVDIANNRMMADVPKAEVVIVNPTHFAVALSWSREKGSAPVCVAKGTDEVALRIREVAAAAGVPIFRDPPTARSLHATVRLGEEIRPEAYRAVAAAIHFAETMRVRARNGGAPAQPPASAEGHTQPGPESEEEP